jgi:hypothetical protein
MVRTKVSDIKAEGGEARYAICDVTNQAAVPSS